MSQRDDMQCDVDKITYDFEKRAGVLFMKDGDCCDMKGCVLFFSSIDPNVQKIETFSGPELDTSYVRSPAGWTSIRDGRAWGPHQMTT